MREGGRARKLWNFASSTTKEEKDILLICKNLSSQSPGYSPDYVCLFFSLELRTSMRSQSTQKQKSGLAVCYSSVDSANQLTIRN